MGSGTRATSVSALWQRSKGICTRLIGHNSRCRRSSVEKLDGVLAIKQECDVHVAPMRQCSSDPDDLVSDFSDGFSSIDTGLPDDASESYGYNDSLGSLYAQAASNAQKLHQTSNSQPIDDYTLPGQHKDPFSNRGLLMKDPEKTLKVLMSRQLDHLLDQYLSGEYDCERSMLG